MHASIAQAPPHSPWPPARRVASPRPVRARREPSPSAAPSYRPSGDLLASAFRLAAPNRVIDTPIIAQALGLTEAQLERLVLRTYAVSARHLLLITRLDLAHEKLHLDPLAAVGDVARGYGFADAIAFGRAFVERFGVTPLAVRGSDGRQARWPRSSRLDTL